MKIHIKGYLDALNFIPQKKTIAIRIFDPITFENDYPVNNARKNLRYSPLYVSTLGYTFNEFNLSHVLLNINENLHDLYLPHLFNKQIASKLLSDFSKVKDKGLELMVHCHSGQHSSVTLAIALNEIFDLGDHDIENLKERRGVPCSYIYDTLCFVAKGLS